MKIPDQDIGRHMEKALSGLKGPAKPLEGKNAKPATEQSPAPATDQVHISGKARDVQRLNQLVTEVPDVRAGKVEALQKQIAAGTYGADGRAIAEKMVESTLLDKVL